MHPGTTNSGKQVKTALFESYYAKHDKDVGLSKIEACYVSIKKIRLGCTATSERSALVNLVPRVFSLSNMAAAGEKTLAHSELKRSLIGAFHSAFIRALSLVYSFQNKDG